MQEQASAAETAPEVRPPAADTAAAVSPPVPAACPPSASAAAAQGVAAAGRGRAPLRFLLAPFLAFVRRPARSLAVLALLAIIGASLSLAGWFCWGTYHLRAARHAVAK